uniref:Store-operated calcium entry-associated regulatory factor n=1 Tax=Ascaris lumbricoides TaxID=6252 RepID=A0A0M3IME6_ASCLU
MGSPPPPGFKTGQGYPDAPPAYDEACGRPNPAHAESSGPGFLSGLGLGGLAGYMLGRSQNRDYGTFRHRGPSQFDRDTGFYDVPSTSRERRTPSPSTRTTSGSVRGNALCGKSSETRGYPGFEVMKTCDSLGGFRVVRRNRHSSESKPATELPSMRPDFVCPLIVCLNLLIPYSMGFAPLCSSAVELYFSATE